MICIQNTSRQICKVHSVDEAKGTIIYTIDSSFYIHGIHGKTKRIRILKPENFGE